MSEKRYILHPGTVFRPDGDEHFIGIRKLCELYRVTIEECLVCAHCQGRRALPCVKNHKKYVHLFPSSIGDYELP